MADYRMDSLARVATVLECLGQSAVPLSHKELVERTGITSATLFRMLAALDHHGFVRKNPRTRRYVLGPRIFAIGAKRNAIAALRRHTAPFLRRLASATGGIAQLGSLEGSQVVIDLQFDDGAQMAYSVTAGDYCEAHATALGKLLLAFVPETKVDAIYRHRPLVPLTPQTTTRISELKSSLASIRRQRFAIEIAEFDERLASLAAPLTAPSGRVNHAIALVTTRAALQERQSELRGGLIAAAGSILQFVLKA